VLSSRIQRFSHSASKIFNIINNLWNSIVEDLVYILYELNSDWLVVGDFVGACWIFVLIGWGKLLDFIGLWRG